MENLLWKRLWTSRKGDCRVNERMMPVLKPLIMKNYFVRNISSVLQCKPKDVLYLVINFGYCCI